MKICPACGYPSAGICAACVQTMRADREASGALIVRSSAARVVPQQLSTERAVAPPSLVNRGDHYGARAARVGAVAESGTT
jgi:hypothetical protein